MQDRFPLRCLIASLAFELDSTDTRGIKIIKNQWFLLCFMPSHSSPLSGLKHANLCWRVLHAPLKNQSKLVSYTNENPFKTTANCNIAQKTAKTLCGRPKLPPRCLQHASKMPPIGLKYTSKRQKNQQDAPRSLKEMRKTPLDTSVEPQYASKPRPRRLRDAPKRLQDALGWPKNQSRRQSSDTNEKHYCTPI